jgi:arylformamidase
MRPLFPVRQPLSLLLATVLTTLLPAPSHAGPLRDMIKARQQATTDTHAVSFELPRNIQRLRDVPYGAHERQRMDVYLPSDTAHTSNVRPVILMVHGGAWRIGDKAAAQVVANKVKHWLAQGFILISVNYRLLPEANPLQQADDVALALAKAQSQAAQWGADPHRFILMGHSAGAHLVALLNAAPERAVRMGALPWKGTVALDSAAMDVVTLMQAHHLRLYDQAFGKDKAVWEASSPVQQLSANAPPLLAVCSSQRDDACPQAHVLQTRATTLGLSVQVLPQNLSHREINETLGQPGDYTRAVDTFLNSLLSPPRPSTTTPQP